MSEFPEIPGYTIEKKLGEGGMATVFLAIQNNLKRKVAIKILEPLLLKDKKFAERFLKEAETSASLSHHNIVTIYDVGKFDNTYYIVMEYLGESLKDKLEIQRVIKPKEALDILINIADALNHAHGKGFIHRDIKPDNILFRPDNSPVIVDFGIAKAVDSSTKLTKTGMSIGTPHYMSPEQIRGQKIDGRSDIYSLGVMFFEMLTGKIPYEGTDTIAIAMKHVQEPIPDLRSGGFGISGSGDGEIEKLQNIINLMMAKDPEDRPQTGAELIELLSQETGDLGPGTGRLETGVRRPGTGRLETGVRRQGTVVDHPSVEKQKSPRSSLKPDLSVTDKGKTEILLPESRDFSREKDTGRKRLITGLSITLLVFVVLLFIFLISNGSAKKKEEDRWMTAKSTHTISSYNSYLATYPDGKHSDLARWWINSLKAQEEANKKRIAQEAAKRERDRLAKLRAEAEKRRREAEAAKAELARLKRAEEQRQEQERLAVEKKRREEATNRRGSSSNTIAATISVSNFEFVKVEGGEFNMGSRSGGSDEKPVHRVYVDTFYISKYEVTFDQYDKYCESTGANKPYDEGWGRGKRPVINVSWNDAVSYCKWLSRKTGRDIHLPTEAQWEYASRGGNRSRGYKYSGSDSASEVGWYDGNSGSKTHRVGEKIPNELGLYDMSGNVWEWCLDWYGGNYYNSSPYKNPKGPSSGSFRVRRGGGWGDNARYMRSANRSYDTPSYRRNYLGFRLVLD